LSQQAKISATAEPAAKRATPLYVVKIGGNIIDDPAKLASFLKAFAGINAPKILVHGGGKLATKLADQLGIEQKLIDGRRITDEETLRIVTMVYAGYINKNIVAALQAHNCNAIGMTGADADLIHAEKRKHPTIDYGFVGDVKKVKADIISSLLLQGICLVIAPITHNGEGQLLNTNADTIAQEIAKAMSENYQVNLVYSFEKAGVLLNAADDNTVIPVIDPALYEDLKAKQAIFAGMIPKLDNAFTALKSGVSKVIIGKAENLDALITGKSGTAITA